MSNELYEHKRSDTIKWVLTLLAFILVGVMLAGIILGWFDKKETEEEQAGVPVYSFIVGNGEGNRMSLTSVRNSAVTGESVTITATVEPDNEAENTGVDWTATWKNAGSVWASGKSVSDYVTLTPGGEDYAASKSVTLENLQPFGEQIVVKATARDDPEITAYYEFLNFYQMTGLNVLVFKRPGEYRELMEAMGRTSREPWSAEEIYQFRTFYYMFRDACRRQNGDDRYVAQAFLVYIKLFGYQESRTKLSSQILRELPKIDSEIRNRLDNAGVTLMLDDQGKRSLFAFPSTGKLCAAFVHSDFTTASCAQPRSVAVKIPT